MHGAKLHIRARWTPLYATASRGPRPRLAVGPCHCCVCPRGFPEIGATPAARRDDGAPNYVATSRRSPARARPGVRRVECVVSREAAGRAAGGGGAAYGGHRG